MTMRTVKICDTTLRTGGRKEKTPLTFKETIELAKLLDRLNVDVITIDGIGGKKAEALRVKSVCSAVKKACVCVPVAPDGSDAKAVFAAMAEAPARRLLVELPVSFVQMEYLSHRKPDQLLAAAGAAVEACAALCDDVEFHALDATRADREFLYKVIAEVIAKGAKTVTLSDSAGRMLPDEMILFLKELRENVPAVAGVTLGIACSDRISMAVSCAVAGIYAGVGELKTVALEEDGIRLEKTVAVLEDKAQELSAVTNVRTTELGRVLERMHNVADAGRSSGSPFDDGVREETNESYLSVHDTEEAVARAAAGLGYDLSDEDGMRVYEAFRKVAEKKEKVSTRELEVLIASEAMQVPESYRLESYMVTSGNQIEATAHIKLRQAGKTVDGISLGDGPIDAAFLAIEKITGCHYELDDFQIQAITEGREALGQTIVRLRAGGKLYSGRGTSTDIIGSAVKAYINALNKIVYEEERA